MANVCFGSRKLPKGLLRLKSQPIADIRQQ
jgi:hypothetical protein